MYLDPSAPKSCAYERKPVSTHHSVWHEMDACRHLRVTNMCPKEKTYFYIMLNAKDHLVTKDAPVHS
jgi:hypothetical protein